MMARARDDEKRVDAMIKSRLHFTPRVRIRAKKYFRIRYRYRLPGPRQAVCHFGMVDAEISSSRRR